MHDNTHAVSKKLYFEPVTVTCMCDLKSSRAHNRYIPLYIGTCMCTIMVSDGIQSHEKLDQNI